MKYILALLADWANGMFAVLCASWWFSTQPEWWHFLIGILFAHAPDIDALPELFKRGKVAASAEHPSDHRTWLHYPIVLVFVAVVTTWIFGYWGLVFSVAILLHIFNDFYGTGWGVKLIWPVSTNNFKFLGRRANRLHSILSADGDWGSLSHEERRLRILVTWSAEELPHYIQKWGIDDWVGPYYLRINWVNAVEFSLFLIACALTLNILL